MSVAARYMQTYERAFLTSGATRGRARNNWHFTCALHENQAGDRRLTARVTRILPRRHHRPWTRHSNKLPVTFRLDNRQLYSIQSLISRFGEKCLHSHCLHSVSSRICHVIITGWSSLSSCDLLFLSWFIKILNIIVLNVSIELTI